MILRCRFVHVVVDVVTTKSLPVEVEGVGGGMNNSLKRLRGCSTSAQRGGSGERCAPLPSFLFGR